MVQVLYSCIKNYKVVLELLKIIYPLTLQRESEARSRSQQVRKPRVDPASPRCRFDAYTRVPYLHILTREVRQCFVVGGCPMHCRMFSNISGLHPLDARSTSAPNCDNQKCLQTWTMSPI